MRILAAGVCFLQLASTPSAAEPELVKLAVSAGEDIGPHSVLGPVTHVSQDRAGIMWLSTRTGLHRLDPASGAFRHYAHDPADPDSLSSSVVRSAYEDREGTLWVCTLAGLDAFDRRTEKVTERIRLPVAESPTVRALEDHAGVLWIIYAFGNGLGSWDRHTRRLTLYSFDDREPPAMDASGGDGIHEDADGNLWLATRVSGLIRIDRDRRSAVRYRHSALNPDSISEDLLRSMARAESTASSGSGSPIRRTCPTRPRSLRIAPAICGLARMAAD